MSYTSRIIAPLFNTVGVTAYEQSPLCRIFSSTTNLRDELIAYLPRTFSFGDASGTAEPSNKNDEACDAPAASPENVFLKKLGCLHIKCGEMTLIVTKIVMVKT